MTEQLALLTSPAEDRAVAIAAAAARGVFYIESGDLRDADTFREPARARSTDPDTSHEAAAFVTGSGIADTQAEAVLIALRRFPGLTRLELATRAEMDPYLVARRLPELRGKGFARKGEKRICGASTRRLAAYTWFATAPNS